MAVDKNTPEVPGAPAGDDPPDWTTWLRSRLERVVTSEGKGTDSESEGPAATEPEAVTAPPAPPPSEGPSTGDSGRQPALAALADRVHVLAEAIAGCRALIEEQGATGQRLVRWMQELATTQADDERWAVAVGRVLDEVDEERREAGERAEAALASLSARVERIEEGLGQISTEIAGLRHRLPWPPTTPPVKLGEPQLETIAASIATAVAARSAPPAATADGEPAAGSSAGEQPHNGAGSVRSRPRRRSPLRAAPLPPAGHTTRDG